MKCTCDPNPMAEASGDARMVQVGAPSVACRINELPSDVLTRAISFLDARQLVQTCVLSLQWRDLWRSVPRINVSREEFDGMPGTWFEQNMLFKKFFNRSLMLRNPTPLDEFNLSYGLRDRDNDAESEDANLWIGHALQCNARSVKVYAWGARLHLDRMMFASKCFLTSLELTSVVLFAGFFKNLQMGCTLLERLKLYDCPICDAEVSSQTLTLLTLDGVWFTHSEQASISIPSLVTFVCSSFVRPPLLTNLGSLETATVSIGTYTDIRQFLRDLSNATHLDLCYNGPKLKVKANFQWCPKFNNLTTLSLREWCLCAVFNALIVFLQNSPNLMELILKIRKSPETYVKFIGELEGYFTCEHLKIVEIICPENWEEDHLLNDLVKFLVGNGISSDQIEIKNWH